MILIECGRERKRDDRKVRKQKKKKQLVNSTKISVHMHWSTGCVYKCKKTQTFPQSRGRSGMKKAVRRPKNLLINYS